MRSDRTTVSVRVSWSTIAIALAAYRSIGQNPRTKGELLRWIIEDYTRDLAAQTDEPSVISTEEAKRMLNVYFASSESKRG